MVVNGLLSQSWADPVFRTEELRCDFVTVESTPELLRVDKGDCEADSEYQL